jgi:hypothetical protein
VVALERLPQRHRTRQVRVERTDLGLGHGDATLDEGVDQLGHHVGPAEVGPPRPGDGGEREAPVLERPDRQLVVRRQVVDGEVRPEAQHPPSLDVQGVLRVLLEVDRDDVGSFREDAEEVQGKGQRPGPQADPGEGIAVGVGHQHPRSWGAGWRPAAAHPRLAGTTYGTEVVPGVNI